MILKKTLYGMGAMLVVSSLLTACGGSSGSGDAGGSKTVSIGAIFPLTGNAAAPGNDGLDAIRVAADVFNAQSTGVKVKIVAANATTAAEAQAAAQRLVTQNHVHVIMGTTLSLLGIPASAQADRLGAIYWDTVDASPVISNRGLKQVFQFEVQGTTTGAAAPDYVKAVLAPAMNTPLSDLKVGIINTSDEYGSAVGQGMVDQSKVDGVTIVNHQTYDASITDMSSIILKLKNSGVQVLMASTLGTDAVLLNKQMRQANFNPVVVDGLGFDNPASATALKSCINGTFVSSSPQTPSINPDKLTPEGAKLYKLYSDGYAKAAKKETSIDSDANFSGAWAFFKYVLAPAPDPNDVKALASSARALDLPLGALPNGFGIKFDSNQYNQRTLVGINQFQDGKEVAVFPEVVAKAKPIMVPRPSWESVCNGS